MPKRHTPQQLTNLLAQSSGNLAQIAQKSMQLSDLNNFLVGCVGDTIAQNCRVSNYAHGILTIETDNSAFATRLNFMSARILSNFRQNVLPELADIYIKVMPAQQYEQKSEIKPAKSRHISEHASQSLLEVAAHAPDSLKRKLEKLASHVAKHKGE